MVFFHLALIAPGIYNNEGIMKGALEAGFEYHCFDFQRVMFEFDKDTMRRRLVQEVEKVKPDIVFCQIQTSELLDYDTFKALSKIAFVINFTFDIRSKEQTEWMYNLAPEIGLTCFSNENDVIRCKRRGYENVMCVHSSVDMDVYKPSDDEDLIKSDITFIGNNYLNTLSSFPKSQQRSDMVGLLRSEFPEHFKVYGMGWTGKIVNPKEEVEIYQRSLMAINQNNFNALNYSSDRLWRILGCGCLCLTEYFEGIEIMFENHVHLVWWKTFEELRSAIHYYSAHHDEALEIGKKGAALVRERHTWKNRIQEIMQYVIGVRINLPTIDACTKAGAHVIGGIIPGQFDEHLAGKPCDCGKLLGSWIDCGCAVKQKEFRWTENI